MISIAPGETKPVICQLLHGLTVGGAEVLAARLVRALGDEFRFIFACLDEIGPLGDQLRSEGYPLTLLDRKPGLDWRCSRNLARLVCHEKAVLIHAHQYTPFVYATMSRFFCRRTPVLFTEHGRWFPDLPSRRRMIANRVLLSRRDRVVGVGEAVRQALVANEGLAPARVGVVYNGVDIEQIAATSIDRNAFRRELGCEQDDFLLAQVARLDGLKDHRTAIQTMAEVVRTVPRARLLIVGSGPEQEAIEQEIRRLQVEPFVRMLGTRHDVPQILKASDACLLTSISEGIPLTLIEAMAARLPVVSTRVGGVPEVVAEGTTGFLAPSGDARALAARVADLATDEPLRVRLGDAALARAREMFSESRMHAAYRNLYREMIRA